MKYFSLIWASLFRSKLRTLLTLLSIVTAFLLFGMLDSVRVAFGSAGNSVAGANRLVVASRLSITQMLPYSLDAQIRQVPGVKDAAYAAWFGGIYRDMRNFFPNFSVGPDYIRIFSEYEMPKAQREAFANTRDGAVIGEALAQKFGWKIGDTIPLQATIFPKKDGSNAWPVKLVGIFKVNDAKRKGEEQQLWMRWDYFDEANQFVHGQVGWWTVTLKPGADPDRVARAIDAISANSSHETKTQTEAAFNQSFVKQIADIGLIVTSIMGAVFFTLILLTGNTMAQAVRERIPELAVLKTLGFTNRSVLWMVLVESVLLVMLGGLIGMLLASAAIPGLNAALRGGLQINQLPMDTWLMGLGLMLVIGVLVGLLPAIRGMRLNIVDALAGR